MKFNKNLTAFALILLILSSLLVLVAGDIFLSSKLTSSQFTGISPARLRNISGTNFNLSVSIRTNTTHGRNMANVSFMWRLKSNQSVMANITVRNNTANDVYFNRSFNTRTIPDGRYNISILAYNVSTISGLQSGVYNGSVSINVTVDNTAPLVTFRTPTNVSNFTRRSSNRTFNASIRDLTAQKVLFSFDNASGNGFNITATNKSGHWSASYNVSKLAEGSHIVAVIANDSQGNRNNSRFFTFRVDNTAPRVSWTTPTNVSNYTRRSSNRTFNVSILELRYVQSVRFSFDNATGNGFNITARNRSGYWSASYNVSRLAEGRHTITVIANDSVGNRNNTQRITITVDNTAPNVTFERPVNKSIFNNCLRNQSFNVSIFDTNLTIYRVKFEFSNGTAFFNRTAVNRSGIWNVHVNLSSIAQSNLNSVRAYANDTNGNANNSDTINFNLDCTAPTISLSKSTSTETTLTIGISTTGDAQSCTSTQGIVSGTGSSQTVSATGLNPSTSYSFTVTCNDEAGNRRSLTQSFATDESSGGESSSGGASGGSSGGASTTGGASGAGGAITGGSVATDTARISAETGEESPRLEGEESARADRAISGGESAVSSRTWVSIGVIILVVLVAFLFWKYWFNKKPKRLISNKF